MTFDTGLADKIEALGIEDDGLEADRLADNSIVDGGIDCDDTAEEMSEVEVVGMQEVSAVLL